MPRISNSVVLNLWIPTWSDVPLSLQVRRPKGDTLEEMGKPLFFRDVEQKYGTKWNFYHRVDAHNSLKELATDPSLPGKPATIRLASSC